MKSPIIYLAAFFAVAYISRHQRPPWLIMVFVGLVFLGIITPFVHYGRNIALQSGAEDSATRKKIFEEILQDKEAFLPTVKSAMPR